MYVHVCMLCVYICIHYTHTMVYMAYMAYKIKMYVYTLYIYICIHVICTCNTCNMNMSWRSLIKAKIRNNAYYLQEKRETWFIQTLPYVYIYIHISNVYMYTYVYIITHTPIVKIEATALLNFIKTSIKKVMQLIIILVHF